MNAIRSYKDLIIWKKSMELVKKIYLLTAYFPKSEIYGLSSQIQRSCISIPSNIAEGWGRKSKKEFRQFLSISYGSSLELETQLIIGKELNYAKSELFEECMILLEEIIKMLNVMTLRERR